MNQFIEKFRQCETDNERLKLLRDTQFKNLSFNDEEKYKIDEELLSFDGFGYELLSEVFNFFGIESEVE